MTFEVIGNHVVEFLLMSNTTRIRWPAQSRQGR